MTPLMFTYLACALLGACTTWYFNIQHFLTSDIPFTPITFVESGLTSPMSSSLTSDFLVLTTVVLIWMVFEARRLGMKRVWLYLVLSFGIAIAFAFPLFLFIRERRLTS